MDYKSLANEWIALQGQLLQVPACRELSSLSKGEWFVLNYLMGHAGLVHPKDLSKGLVVSTARIAALLNHMEEQGLVTRNADPEDNRKILVYLTDAGVQMIPGLCSAPPGNNRMRQSSNKGGLLTQNE